MNMNALMQQAQKLQKDMEKQQKAIQEGEYVGESQLVKVVFSGNRKMINIEIKDINNMDSEDLEMLQDMIKIAVNDAMEKIDKEIEKKMGGYSKYLGGLM